MLAYDVLATDIIRRAEGLGFAVVAPQGTRAVEGYMWNADKDASEAPNDVGFIFKLRTYLKAEINFGNAFVLGLEQGAALSYGLAVA